MQMPTTLPELVELLGKTYSPFERLKILSRAWSLLRGMTAEQRMIVAAQLGLDHADELVESITRRSGKQASPALISLIEKAQVKGTPHLPELISDLRDPGKRADRLRQGAAAVGTALAEGDVNVPWLPAGTAAATTAVPKPEPKPEPPPPAPAPVVAPVVAPVPVAAPAPVPSPEPVAAPVPPPRSEPP